MHRAGLVDGTPQEGTEGMGYACKVVRVQGSDPDRVDVANQAFSYEKARV